MTHPPKPSIHFVRAKRTFEEAISLQQTDKATREVVRSRKKRLGAVAALIALIGSFMAYAISTAPVARADTTQSNGCLGVTGTFSAFNVPITGAVTANPGTVNPGSATIGADTITLSGASVTI